MTRRTTSIVIGLSVIASIAWVASLDTASAQRRHRHRHRGEDAGVDASIPDAGPDATPDAEVPDAEPPPVVETPLREDLGAVMDDLVTARARIASIGRQLFHSQVTVRVDDRTEDAVLERIALTLDGAPILSSRGSELGEGERQVFSGFAAPGPHVLGIELTQSARASDAYGYTLRESYRFEAVRERRTEVTIVLDGELDIAEDFADDGEGEYDVRTRVRVATRELSSER